MPSCRYLSVDELIDFAENGVKGGGLAGMHKRYAAGERSSEFTENTWLYSMMPPCRGLFVP